MKTRIENVKEHEVYAATAKIGQLMVVITQGSDVFNHVLLRTYQGLVSLTDPNYTWKEESTPSFMVRILDPSETVFLNNE